MVSYLLCYTNSSPPRQNGRLFADDIFRSIFLNEKFCLLVKNFTEAVPTGIIDNIPELVQIMALHWIGDKQLFEPMMVILLTHISVFNEFSNAFCFCFLWCYIQNAKSDLTNFSEIDTPLEPCLVYTYISYIDGYHLPSWVLAYSSVFLKVTHVLVQEYWWFEYNIIQNNQCDVMKPPIYPRFNHQLKTPTKCIEKTIADIIKQTIINHGKLGCVYCIYIPS